MIKKELLSGRFIAVLLFLFFFSISVLDARAYRKRKWRTSSRQTAYFSEAWVGWSFPFTKSLALLDDAKLEASEAGGSVEYSKSDISLGVDLYRSFSSFQLGLGFAYLRFWNFSYNYIHRDVFYGNEKMKMDNSSAYLPLTLQFRKKIYSRFYLGAGLGYAFNLNFYEKCTDELCVEEGTAGNALILSFFTEYHYPLNKRVDLSFILHAYLLMLDPVLFSITPSIALSRKF